MVSSYAPQMCVVTGERTGLVHERLEIPRDVYLESEQHAETGFASDLPLYIPHTQRGKQLLRIRFWANVFLFLIPVLGILGVAAVCAPSIPSPPTDGVPTTRISDRAPSSPFSCGAFFVYFITAIGFGTCLIIRNQIVSVRMVRPEFAIELKFPAHLQHVHDNYSAAHLRYLADGSPLTSFTPPADPPPALLPPGWDKPKDH